MDSHQEFCSRAKYKQRCLMTRDIIRPDAYNMKMHNSADVLSEN